MSGLIMALRSAVLGVLLAAANPGAAGAEWGKPLGAGYEGAEGQTEAGHTGAPRARTG